LTNLYCYENLSIQIETKAYFKNLQTVMSNNVGAADNITKAKSPFNRCPNRGNYNFSYRWLDENALKFIVFQHFIPTPNSPASSRNTSGACNNSENNSIIDCLKKLFLQNCLWRLGYQEEGPPPK